MNTRARLLRLIAAAALTASLIDAAGAADPAPLPAPGLSRSKLVYTIQIKVPGASALSVEREVMRPLESAMRTVIGLRTIRSTAQIGQLQTRMEFDESTNAEKTATLIRQKLADVKRRFPPRTTEPLLSWGRQTSLP